MTGIKKIKHQAGFTLIELIVVMAIFLFIVGAALGIFLSIVDSQKQVLDSQQLLGQISYLQEHMSKAIRMAKTDTTGSCLGSGNEGYIYLLTHYKASTGYFEGIKFFNQSDNFCTELFLDNGAMKELKNNPEPDNAVPVTSTALKIEFVRFSINGSNGSAIFNNPLTTGCANGDTQCGAWYQDSIQPRVTILFNLGGDKVIQTTVSQRSLNTNNGQR